MPSLYSSGCACGAAKICSLTSAPSSPPRSLLHFAKKGAHVPGTYQRVEATPSASEGRAGRPRCFALLGRLTRCRSSRRRHFCGRTRRARTTSRVHREKSLFCYLDLNERVGIYVDFATGLCSPIRTEPVAMSAKKLAVENSSGNVFKDLGLRDAEQRLAKAELARVIRRLLQEARPIAGGRGRHARYRATGRVRSGSRSAGAFQYGATRAVLARSRHGHSHPDRPPEESEQARRSHCGGGRRSVDSGYDLAWPMHASAAS